MLKNKTALVTGASRGIGKAIALGLAKEGANVVVNYSNSGKKAEDVVNEIKKLNSKSIALKADVSNFDEVKRMIDSTKKIFKKVDILVNNAGIIRDRTLKKMSIEEWNRVININLSGVFNVTKLVLPLMDVGGRIINISSVVGQNGNFGQCNYSASKAGIIGFSKSLAKELGKKKITVNVIAPGYIKTDITKDIPFFKKKILKYIIPLREEGVPEDIANVAVFLASEKARYMTGSVVNVDGGLSF